ncbi:MAG: sigma-54-dependent Fis family transcriptional regulator [Planctomycetes bacterium]|nr:sigma-54-dependent Fis family transcriptional regulator [Planctomycetota bacterium]
MQTLRLLVADDEPDIHALIGRCLSPGATVTTVGGGRPALEALEREPFDVLVTDLRMPDLNGLDLIRSARSRFPAMGIVLVTAYGGDPESAEALRLGASQCLEKPFRVDALLEAVRRAAAARTEEPAGFHGIVGSGPAMVELQRRIRRVAGTGASVLVAGETGTGKELVARALHLESGRPGNFVPVVCSALPAEVFESEVFGHVRGAYSGAVGPRAGLARHAAGGTLFLDEVGETPPALQVKLLRLLQEREVRPVGSDLTESVDLRVVAATNRDLGRAVAEGGFREDLYYRLRAVTLVVPPLRERPEDLRPLAAHLLGRLAARHGLPAPHLAEEALRRLEAHRWPGNVRELDHVLEEALLFSEGGTLRPEDLGALVGAAASPGDDPEAGGGGDLIPLEAMEARLLRSALQEAGGSRTRAAAILGVDRKTVLRKLRRHGLAPATPRPTA